MGKLIAALLLAASLSGCQSMLLYENSRRGTQPDEILINLALWASITLATKYTVETTLEDFQ